MFSTESFGKSQLRNFFTYRMELLMVFMSFSKHSFYASAKKWRSYDAYIKKYATENKEFGFFKVSNSQNILTKTLEKVLGSTEKFSKTVTLKKILHIPHESVECIQILLQT